MDVSSALDWISVTVLKTTTKDAPRYLQGVERKPISGKNGYTSGWLYRSGSMQFWNDSSSRMGTHIVHSGQALQWLRDNKVPSEELIEYHQNHGNRFSRIDYALDMVGDDTPTIMELMTLHENKQVKTLVRTKPKLIQLGLSQQETMTIGSTTSRTKLLQIYRKDIEQKLEGFAGRWLRAELRMYGKNAIKSANYYAECEDKHSATTSLISGFCDYPNSSAWRSAISSDPHKIGVDAHKTGNTEEWLMTQVLPALARVTVENPSFLEHFEAKLWQAIEVERSKWSTE